MSQVSILAGIIQGEARNPADQYGVASVIYNRTLAGFPGSQNGAFGVATARSQFSAYPNGLQTPTPYATQLATNLVNGQPPGTASTGNALYYNAPGFNAAYASGSGNDFGPGTNQYSDRFNQPPSSNFQLPGGAGSDQNQQSLDMSNFGTQPIPSFDPNLGNQPQTIPDQPVDAAPTSTVDQGNIPAQTPILDGSGNQIGTEATIPEDFSTLQNFGAVDPTAGSAFGGAFDSTGNVVAGSSGDIGGLGLPGGLFAGGSGGGGLGYQVQPGNVQAGNEAVTGQPTPVPDVANAISNVGKGINTTLGAAGTAVSKGILGGVADAVTSAENWAGNLFARGGVMVLAVILALIGGYLLYQRSSGGGRTAIIPA